jgi:putative ABC transport system permease protein
MFNFLVETFLLGLKNLRLHKLRSLLTALGIILGVAAVIGMVAIGEGTKQQALEQISHLGAQNILVRSQKPPESNQATNRTQRVLDYGLKRVDLERLKTIPGLVTIVPLRDTEQNVVLGDTRAPGANAIGTTPDIFTVINLKLSRGNVFDWIQYDDADTVCVLGSKVARDLFPFQDPIGQTVQIGTSGMACTICTVIGVLEPTGLRAGSEGASMMQRDLDQDIYFPLTLARTTFGDSIIRRQAGSMERKQIELSEVWLKADSIDNVERIAKIAQNLVEVDHKQSADVDVKAPIQILRAAEEQKRVWNFVLVAIASISLVVGGIGIMNIMLASVTERTREIGIRRALGAKQRHITLQFLIETTVISLTGGLIGVALGIGIAWAVEWATTHFGTQAYRTSVTTWSVVGSFIISGLVGIGFGLYPAVTAAKMNPIEALRHE